MSDRRRRVIALLFFLAAGIGGSGCLGLTKPKLPELPPLPVAKPPPQLTLKITAAADANRDPDGKGLAVEVRAYELKSHGVFTKADFFSLYDRDSAVLGGDVLTRDEVTLAPEQFFPIARPLNPDATYIGVIAAFRDLDHSRWREVIRLNPMQDNNVQIDIGAAAVSIRHQ